MDNDNQADATLTNFFQEFIKRHSVVGADEGEVELDITPEECEMLGRSFVHILSHWISGLKVLTVVKFLTRLVTNTSGGELNVVVTSQECEELGRDFIQIMVGWAAGLKVSRQKRFGTGIASTGAASSGIGIDSTKSPSHLKVVNLDEHRGEN